jgi:hypothetical protein
VIISKKPLRARLMPGILAIQEAEIRRIASLDKWFTKGLMECLKV